LTEEASLPVIQGIPEIALPLVFPRKAFAARGLPGVFQAWRWARDKRGWLRERGSPRVVDLHGTYKSALLARTLAPDRLIGYPRRETKEPVQFLYRELIELPAEIPSRFARYEAMFRALGLEGAGLDGLPLAKKHLEAGAQLVAGRKVAVLVVGTSKKEAWKRWPAARFGELAARLKAELNLTPLIAWGPGEEDLRDAAAAGGAAEPLPVLPLLDLFGVLANAALVIAADTGPLHAAALLGTPSVGLFGATSPILNKPWGDQCVIVAGHPEPWRNDYRGRSEFMDAITVEQALAGALKALG
jgi:ADP-heptose:LPS heptosyltransferase